MAMQDGFLAELSESCEFQTYLSLDWEFQVMSLCVFTNLHVQAGCLRIFGPISQRSKEFVRGLDQKSQCRGQSRQDCRTRIRYSPGL